jgi:phenylalanyl-tRNA synthetase beta chain
MKVLYNWLKEFVELTEPPAELARRFALCGVPVESLEESPAGPLLDLEIFSNRGDLLGHYGVAREAAAALRAPLRSVQTKLREAAARAADATRVEIECPELCGRYTARVIRGVRVGASPEWLRQRLAALGQNAINNVVDATNYVMLELGHPMHAFDLDTLAGGRIVVRRARPGETLTTLDGVERKLSPEMCVIADAQRSVAIGGVMGGAETEISPFSTNVLLESAWFEPVTLRRTARALGLRTEASLRFERGADLALAELASRRCAELIQQIAGGEILAGVVDACPLGLYEQHIELTRRELLRVMGADVPDREMEAILEALGFAPVRVDAARGTEGSLLAAWRCQRPSWRLDVAKEIDLIEEVARHYGFEKFPARAHPAKQPAARLAHAAAQDAVRERLLALGYDEIVTIPMVDDSLDALFRHQGLTPATLANPIARDAATLRTSGLVGMLRALEWNLNRGQRSLRLFEIGARYELRDSAPRETRILTLGASGAAREKGVWEAEREFSFADLKGELDSLGVLAGGFAWRAEAPAWLHPARSGSFALDAPANPSSAGAAPWPLGVAGQLARRVAEEFKLRQTVYVAELELDPLFAAIAAARAALRCSPVPRFPAVERDFSVVLDDGIAFAQVAQAIRAAGIAELERVEACDLFRGGQIPKGKYSLLVRVTFQSREATLTEAQLGDFQSRIVAAVEKLGGALRTA